MNNQEPDDLDKLESKIDKARKEFDEDYNPKPETDENLSQGARAGVELVGAMLGGGLIGWLLDKMLDTSPLFFFIFFFLGVVTGFYNIYKITVKTE